MTHYHVYCSHGRICRTPVEHTRIDTETKTLGTHPEDSDTKCLRDTHTVIKNDRNISLGMWILTMVMYGGESDRQNVFMAL